MFCHSNELIPDPSVVETLFVFLSMKNMFSGQGREEEDNKFSLFLCCCSFRELVGPLWAGLHPSLNLMNYVLPKAALAFLHSNLSA